MVKDRQQQYEELQETARALFQQRKYRQAIEQWQGVLTVCAGRPVQVNSALSWIAESYERLGKPKEAAAALESLVAMKQERGLQVQKELLARIVSLRRGTKRG